MPPKRDFWKVVFSPKAVPKRQAVAPWHWTASRAHSLHATCRGYSPSALSVCSPTSSCEGLPKQIENPDETEKGVTVQVPADLGGGERLIPGRCGRRRPVNSPGAPDGSPDLQVCLFSHSVNVYRAPRTQQT